MEFTLVILNLLGYVFIAKRWLKLPIESIPIFVIPLLGLILYFSALMGVLEISASILYYVGLVAFAFSLIFMTREREFSHYFSSGIIIYVGLLCFLWLIVKNSYFNAWDEISFWGKVSKYVFETKALPTVDSPLQFKDYPLGNALFQYYLYHSFGYFSEGIAYFAQNILIYSPLMIITKQTSWQKSLMGLVVLTFFLSVFDKSFLHSVYVDVTVSAFFAGILLTYYALDQRIKRFLIVLPALAFLTIVKQIGLFFAIIASGFFIIDSIVKTVLSYKHKKTLTISSLILALCIPICFFAVHDTWVRHCEALGVQAHGSNMTGKEILTTFSHDLSSERKQVREHFVKVWFAGGIDRFHLTIPVWLIVFFIMWLTIAKKTTAKGNKLQLHILFAMIFLGFFVYSLGLLSLYIFSYAPDEAANLASFDRYISIYLISFCVVSFGLFVQFAHYFDKIKSQKIVIATVSLLVIFIFLSRPIGLSPLRIAINRESNRVLQAIGNRKDVTIHLIYQNSSGREFNTYTYTLLSIKFNEYYSNARTFCSSVGKLYNPNDIWTCKMSAQALRQGLSRYDYVFLAHTDVAFWDQFGKLFKKQDETLQPSLFKVVKVGNDVVFERVF